ncbi:hypothetical protein, partial [Herbaspirillum lusitanum]|uniref:hypothetical protein n=1 Tax=Herbaspirillum lusitanum TaxID=213312 RepID=UPI001EE66F0A
MKYLRMGWLSAVALRKRLGCWVTWEQPGLQQLVRPLGRRAPKLQREQRPEQQHQYRQHRRIIKVFGTFLTPDANSSAKPVPAAPAIRQRIARLKCIRTSTFPAGNADHADCHTLPMPPEARHPLSKAGFQRQAYGAPGHRHAGCN